MKFFTASPLVVADQGAGFLDGTHNELRTAHVTHCRPTNVRPATAEEARAFFEHRRAVRRDLVAYYDSKTFTGD